MTAPQTRSAKRQPFTNAGDDVVVAAIDLVARRLSRRARSIQRPPRRVWQQHEAALLDVRQQNELQVEIDRGALEHAVLQQAAYQVRLPSRYDELGLRFCTAIAVVFVATMVILLSRLLTSPPNSARTLIPAMVSLASVTGNAVAWMSLLVMKRST